MERDINTNTSGPPLLTEAEHYRLQLTAALARIAELEAAGDAMAKVLSDNNHMARGEAVRIWTAAKKGAADGR